MPVVRRAVTEEESPLGPVLDFMQKLWALDHGLQSVSKRMEAELGVTGPQRLVLRIVGEVPGISAGLLAATLRLHRSTLTGVLQRLVAQGALLRKVDPTDARRAHFFLTARGQKLNLTRKGTVESVVERFLAKVPAKRRLVAEELLGQLVRGLEDEVSRPRRRQATR